MYNKSFFLRNTFTKWMPKLFFIVFVDVDVDVSFIRNSCGTNTCEFYTVDWVLREGNSRVMWVLWYVIFKHSVGKVKNEELVEWDAKEEQLSFRIATVDSSCKRSRHDFQIHCKPVVWRIWPNNNNENSIWINKVFWALSDSSFRPSSSKTLKALRSEVQMTGVDISQDRIDGLVRSMLWRFNMCRQSRCFITLLTLASVHYFFLKL